MSGNSAWGFEASEKMTPTKVRPNDVRIFMVRWDFSDEASGHKAPIKYSFLFGLGSRPLWDQLDEYGSPTCAEIRAVRQRDYGNIKLDGEMNKDGEMVFRLRQGGIDGLHELWVACRPVEWDAAEAFVTMYGHLSKRGEETGEPRPL